MDWYLHADDRAAITALRHEVRDYLERHAESGPGIDDAELVIEELVGNAVRHAGGPVWVSLTWSDSEPTFTVRDLGPGFEPDLLQRAAQHPLGVADSAAVQAAAQESELASLAEGGRGLFLVSHLAAVLDAAARRGGGMQVDATLPVRRFPSASIDPPRRTLGALPDLQEARPEGGFGREPFLRALVVQLARTIELHDGPAGAEAAVAQVGADVGGQMEDEFRLATEVVGRMSPAQMAACFVRLKHAIDGGFYVIEANESRIVLGNRRCPFGDAVRLAPSLCRMTSSVFGGIAARNSEHSASVLLEERIAVGDPGCRVVVELDPDDERPSRASHRYVKPR